MNAIQRRNAEIVRRYRAGDNLASIGARIGLTRERVRQIVRDTGAVMPWGFKCAVRDCDTSPRAPARFCFAHQRRLERYGDPLGSKVLLREQHGTLAAYKAGCSCVRCRKANADRVLEYQHRLHPEMRRYGPRTAST